MRKWNGDWGLWSWSYHDLIRFSYGCFCNAVSGQRNDFNCSEQKKLAETETSAWILYYSEYKNRHVNHRDDCVCNQSSLPRTPAKNNRLQSKQKKRLYFSQWTCGAPVSTTNRVHLIIPLQFPFGREIQCWEVTVEYCETSYHFCSTTIEKCPHLTMPPRKEKQQRLKQ